MKTTLLSTLLIWCSTSETVMLEEGATTELCLPEGFPE